jgi:peptide/nickel transport system permease protein
VGGRYLVRRLLQFVPTFIGISLLTFLLVKLAPGDPSTAFGDELAPMSSSSSAAWHLLKGLDLPWWQQYLEWLRRLATFDFGNSFVDERPVAVLLAEALPRTLLLTGSALAIAYAVALPVGVLSAVHRGRPLERLVAGALVALYALPPFLVALLLVVLLAGGEFWQVFPLRGLHSPALAAAGPLSRGLDLAWHLVLPVACLCYPALARTARLQRATMLDVLGQDYIRTARAKGLPERRVIWSHALRNALIPTAALLSTDLPWLLGGSVAIERIFTIPGMGMLGIEAVLRRDFPVIMGVTALAAVVTMLAMLVGDLLQSLLDPRTRREQVAP